MCFFLCQCCTFLHPTLLLPSWYFSSQCIYSLRGDLIALCFAELSVPSSFSSACCFLRFPLQHLFHINWWFSMVSLLFWSPNKLFCTTFVLKNKNKPKKTHTPKKTPKAPKNQNQYHCHQKPTKTHTHKTKTTKKPIKQTNKSPTTNQLFFQRKVLPILILMGQT